LFAFIINQTDFGHGDFFVNSALFFCAYDSFSLYSLGNKSLLYGVAFRKRDISATPLFEITFNRLAPPVGTL
jgi:hypothetical protein